MCLNIIKQRIDTDNYNVIPEFLQTHHRNCYTIFAVFGNFPLNDKNYQALLRSNYQILIDSNELVSTANKYQYVWYQQQESNLIHVATLIKKDCCGSINVEFQVIEQDNTHEKLQIICIDFNEIKWMEK